MSAKAATRSIPRTAPVSPRMSTTRTADVSPPPSKRRRLESHLELAPTLPLRPLKPLESSSLRIFTWNVNGISPFLQPSIDRFFNSTKKRQRSRSSSCEAESSAGGQKSRGLRECLARWEWPHVVCLQEVKIREMDAQTQKAVQQAVKAPKKSSLPGYKAFFNLPKDKVNVRAFGGKMYGVCTLVRDDVFEENKEEDDEVSVLSVDWEREGRVLSMRLPKRKLLIINVYAANGTDYPWKDAAGRVVGTRHQYKREFHIRLHEMVQSYEKFGWFVVVAGDLNIARGIADGFPGIRLHKDHVKNREHFHKHFIELRRGKDEKLPIERSKKENHGDSRKPLIAYERGRVEAIGLGMVDSFREIHGDERKYTYRSPNTQWGASCDRVDMILLTRGLEAKPSALTEADILDAESERGPSDHLPSFVTIDLSRIDERLKSGQTHLDDTLKDISSQKLP